MFLWTKWDRCDVCSRCPLLIQQDPFVSQCKENSCHSKAICCLLIGFFWFDSGTTIANVQWDRHNTPGLSETKPCLSYPQRLLPIDGANDLFYQPPPSMPTSKIYTIRPYFPKDEVRHCVLNLCTSNIITQVGSMKQIWPCLTGNIHCHMFPTAPFANAVYVLM